MAILFQRRSQEATLRTGAEKDSEKHQNHTEVFFFFFLIVRKQCMRKKITWLYVSKHTWGNSETFPPSRISQYKITSTTKLSALKLFSIRFGFILIEIHGHFLLTCSCIILQCHSVNQFLPQISQRYCLMAYSFHLSAF